MIQESVVTLNLRVDKHEMYKSLPTEIDRNGVKYPTSFDFIPGEGPKMIEFFVLPTYSYFGDYQILYDLRSQISYKAGDGDMNRICITLNLKKDILLAMMDDYPEARRFYMERSWQRRIEFKRRMHKFYEDLENKKVIHKLCGIDVLMGSDFSESEEGSLFDGISHNISEEEEEMDA
jgi:hypothetical protein